MITIEKMRELEPKFKDLSDEEVEKIREKLYGMAELALETYIEKKKVEASNKNKDEVHTLLS